MNIFLSIITINFNGLDDTCALIDSFPVTEGVEMIVVDNASRNNEADILEQKYPHITVVRSPENVGFAGGNNLGIKASRGKYLFFINNDTVIENEGAAPDRDYFLQPLVERLERSSQTGAVCPKIRFYWENRPIQFAGYTRLSSITLRNRLIGFGEDDTGQHDTARQTPYVHGAAMLVKREVIDRAGYMPECYFLYYEELDWSVRMKDAGYDIWYDPSCTIYHKESKSTGQDSPLRTYYITRNRLLFAKRNIAFPRRVFTYCYLIGVVALRDVLKYMVKRRKDLLLASLESVADFMKGKYNFRDFKSSSL